MTTGPASGVPEPPLAPPPAAGGGRSSVLKWSLFGCTVLSAILIVVLVVLSMKARSILSWALTRVEDQVMGGAGPDVTPAERQAFKDAYAGFVERARGGKASPDEIRAFQKKVLDALADGKVTPDEMRSLAEAAGGAGAKGKP